MLLAQEHGPSPEAELEKFDCNICHDESIVAVLDSGEEMPVGDSRLWDEEQSRFKPHIFRECRCVERKRISRLFRSSHITEQFQSVGFKDFIVTGRPACVKDARDIAVDYYQKFEDIRTTKHNSCALLGPPGSGKTHLLMAISNGLMRKGISVQYFPWVEGFNDLKDNLDELEAKTDAMKRVDVLFLDDLLKGRRNPTDFQLEQLFGIVNFRYLNCLPMLLSSEKDIDALFQIDEGIARRIWERAHDHRVIMGLTPEEIQAKMELNYSLIESKEVTS